MTATDGTVDVGVRAPGFRLPSSCGEIGLDDYHGKSSLVLYFMREFACMSCQMHAASLVRLYPQIRAAGAEVLVVGGGNVKDAVRMAQRIAAPFPILADPDRAVYERYNLDKALGLFQRSATFVIGSDGIVRYAHRSTNPQQGFRQADLLTHLLPR
ncbi:MAG: peroxiredoxin family protein [Capsulimonadaceae bacterium]